MGGVIANVEIIRKEMVKPSSPTPHHLKQLNLSFLDQIAPPPSVFITLIFFYGANEESFHGRQKDPYNYCQLLKSSLSTALTYYYPLAGRLSTTDDTCIDCNDSGALFVEAKVVDTDILHFTLDPDMDDLIKLLPLGIHINGEEEEEQVLLAVQINLMDCGGTAIGVQISHKIADGHSLVSFMNTWATICRGDGDSGIIKPCFDLASLFPPIEDLSRFRSGGPIVITQEKTVTKRLVFDKQKLEILKHAAATANGSLDDHDRRPTRVEVVSAHIWKQFMEAVATKKPKSGGREIILCAVHAVNLRPRMNPSLPQHAFGNIWRPTIAFPPPTTTINEFGDLVGQLKTAIKSVDESFVRRVQNGDEYMEKGDPFVEVAKSKGEIQLCLFTSWCRFPVYEVDYGWGQPVWVTTTISNCKNFSILLSTKSGDGLEAWISMLEEDASLFESDHTTVISSGGQPSA